MKILITGASGFIGQHLAHHLLQVSPYSLVLPIRGGSSLKGLEHTRVETKQIGSITSSTNWQDILRDCNVIIHAAARVHVMNEDEQDALRAFRQINVDGTLNLARQAEKAGIKRFIFLSSIKVNGECTPSQQPFTAEDVVNPQEPYAISKHEAEQGLLKIAQNGRMDVVIIRPPLVYGPGVGGNFFRMLQFLQKSIPLPFASLKHNKRSFVSINNLVHFLNVCISHPLAANEIFLISDDHDLSTVDLFSKIRRLLKNESPLIALPSWILKGVASMVGKQSELMRLSGSLQVDVRKARQRLHWQPIEKVDHALLQTVQDYVEKQKLSLNPSW